MKGETKQYDRRNEVVNCVKREILGNTYLVVVYPCDDRLTRHRVYVYCNKRTGEDFGAWPDSTYKLGEGMESVVKKDVRFDENLSAVTAVALDEAVDEVHKFQEKHKSKQDEIIGGVETIAEEREGEGVK